jgi:hypothetical protein
MLKRPRNDNAPLVLEPDLPANVVSHPARVGRDIAVVKDELRPGGDLLERAQLKALEILANGQCLHANSPTLKKTLGWNGRTVLHQLIAVSQEQLT